MKSVIVSLVILAGIQAHAYSVTPAQFSQSNLVAAANAPLAQNLPAGASIESISLIKTDADNSPVYEVKAGACSIEVTVHLKKIPFGNGNGPFERTAIVTNVGSACQ